MISHDELYSIMKEVSEILRSLQIPHHFTGGVVSSFYGEPRLTQDIDVVVTLAANSDKVRELYKVLAKSFAVNEPAMRDAIGRRSIFQALHNEHFIKVDFHVGEGIPRAFERSRDVEIIPGLSVQMISKEDAILSKLIWISKGSERSRRDVIMMIRNGTPIDEQYIEMTAGELGVVEIWRELKGKAQQ